MLDRTLAARAAVAVLGVVVICGASTAVLAAAGREPVSARIDRYVETMVGAREFQGAVLVARNGRVLLARGYGYANLEQRVRNTPRTQFRLVLATQLFDRIAILQLRDAGKLALDDSVCRHTTPCPQAWRPITIQSLLDHRSGLADLHALLRRASRPPTLDAAVAWLKRQPVGARRPDTSPAASIVLGHIIERASGEQWFAYLQRHILRPAGMTATVQAPNANAHAERWVRTLRSECLDRCLILGRRHLDHLLRVYGEHYKRAPAAPLARVGAAPRGPAKRGRARRCERPRLPARLPRRPHPRIRDRRVRNGRRRERVSATDRVRAERPGRSVWKGFRPGAGVGTVSA